MAVLFIIPTLDELTKALEQEAAAGIGGAGAKTVSAIEGKIGGGQERVRAMQKWAAE